MDWATFDRLGTRAIIFVSLGGWIAGAYAVWPKHATLFGNPKDMNWLAALAVVFVCLGALSTASQLGLFRWLAFHGSSASEMRYNDAMPKSQNLIPYKDWVSNFLNRHTPCKGQHHSGRYRLPMLTRHVTCTFKDCKLEWDGIATLFEDCRWEGTNTVTVNGTAFDAAIKFFWDKAWIDRDESY